MTNLNLQVSGEDRLAITEVINQYFWLADFGRADEIPTLLASEAVLTFGPGSPKPGTIKGQDIVAMFTARAAQKEVTTRHVVSSVRLEAKADGSVSAYCILTLYRSDTPELDSYPLMIADVHDLFVYEGGKWLIRSRELNPIFSRKRA